MILVNRIGISLTLLVFVAGFRMLDPDRAKAIAEKLLKFSASYPVEKAYLHLDRTYYMSGDTIWYRGYLADGFNHHADSVSRVLNVELIDLKKGLIKEQFVTRMENGSGIGNLTIPADLPSGQYTVRAYTNWMRNFGPEYFFEQRIDVVNDLSQETTISSRNADLLDFQVFPEGGEAVTGLSNRIAFKATGSSGLGAEVEGVVLDAASQDTVAHFSSLHKGMGSFELNPVAGKKYTASVRRKGTDLWQHFPLPVALSSGYVMVVDNVSSKSLVKIYIFGSGENQSEDLALVSHTRGMVTVAVNLKLKAGRSYVQVPRAELPDGVTTLTLFSSVGKPVAERLFFVDSGRRLQVDVKPSKQTYGKRERVVMDLMVRDSLGQPVQTALSLAAIDGTRLPDSRYGLTIESYFLLQSDLKGYIEDPGFYFDKGNADARVKLDLLMRTQGWRRFLWEDVLKDSLPEPSRFFESGLTLAGQVLRPNSKEAGVVNLTVMLQARDSSQAFMSTETSEDGRFKIVGIDITDTSRVFIQATRLKGNRNLNIKIDPFIPAAVTMVQIPFNPVQVERATLERLLREAKEYQDFIRKVRENGARMLQEVVIKGRKEKEPDSRKIYGTPDVSIKVTDMMLGGAQTVLDLIRGRVAGLVVNGSGMNASVQIRGGGEPTYVLDGMVIDKDMALSLNVFDVESVDVLKGASAAIFGSRGGNGVISILTKRGGGQTSGSNEPTPGTLMVKFPGYSVARQFYAPKYDVENEMNRRPDFRNTLFWAPMVRTDEEGKAKVSYFNSDAAGTVRVRVEGISSYGLIGSRTIEYQVR